MTDIQLVHASETPYFPIQKFDNETGKPKIKHIYVSIIRFMDGTIKRISIHENRFMVAATCKAIEDLANLYIERMTFRDSLTDINISRSQVSSFCSVLNFIKCVTSLA